MLKYYQFCSNDDPWLTLTYFTARSNLVPYAFVSEKGKTMDFSETIVVYDLKLATDDWSDKKFLLISKLCHLGAVCPLPWGYIHAPSKDSDQPGHPPSLIRVFAVHLKKARILSYPLRAQRRLIRRGRCPGWSESSLGAHAILLVLSWCSSILISIIHKYLLTDINITCKIKKTFSARNMPINGISVKSTLIKLYSNCI